MGTFEKFAQIVNLKKNGDRGGGSPPWQGWYTDLKPSTEIGVYGTRMGTIFYIVNDK